VAVFSEVGELRVKAHLVTSGEKRLSLIELKTFCSGHLPLYMVPDAFVFHETLPKTSTDKTDYQKLSEIG
jgi:acyl-CoA synthetase (AMP-forming)/AMP-acid ligase II